MIKTKKFPVDLGEIPVKLATFKGKFSCILSDLDYLDRLKQYPNHHPILDYFIQDTDGKWFVFYVEDSFDPPLFLIRARSWEDAYETFCDEFSDHMKIEDADLKDYDEDRLHYSASGVPIDDEAAQGHEVTLDTIICG